MAERGRFCGPVFQKDGGAEGLKRDGKRETQNVRYHTDGLVRVGVFHTAMEKVCKRKKRTVGGKGWGGEGKVWQGVIVTKLDEERQDGPKKKEN